MKIKHPEGHSIELISGGVGRVLCPHVQEDAGEGPGERDQRSQSQLSLLGTIQQTNRTNQLNSAPQSSLTSKQSGLGLNQYYL